MAIELFCAFQPNLVMVPSLPLRLGIPAKLLANRRRCRYQLDPFKRDAFEKYARRG
jgi:hypothetical protein